VITLGNWTWGQRDFGGYLAASDRVIRPANMSSEAPGRGVCVAATADGTPVAVINLLGELTLGPAAHPFEVAEHLVEDARKDASVVVVDFHAEATSEKIAMARMLDGKVTAVLGTHTHVQTNDARVLAGGTAAVTDVGMTGPHDSVIGVEAALAIRRMRTQMPVRFHPAEAGVRLEGALVDCDGSGRATSCELVRVEA
jgi:2',3'-cyclic-nucleotide 2'-phosphodiesterase